LDHTFTHSQPNIELKPTKAHNPLPNLTLIHSPRLSREQPRAASATPPPLSLSLPLPSSAAGSLQVELPASWPPPTGAPTPPGTASPLQPSSGGRRSIVPLRPSSPTGERCGGGAAPAARIQRTADGALPLRLHLVPSPVDDGPFVLSRSGTPNRTGLGRRPMSSPTRELGRRTRVKERGIDPEFCDYARDYVQRRRRRCPSRLVVAIPSAAGL